MSVAVTSSPANQDRPLLIHPSSQPSDQRRFRTLLDLLTIDKMDGSDRTMRREEESISKWKILKERLGLKVIGCCGVATWRFDNSSSTSPEEEGNLVVLQETSTSQQEETDDVEVVVGTTTNEEGMNLGAALAAERQFRAVESRDSYGVDEGNFEMMMTPSRVSLMRLLEETTDGCDLGKERSKGGEERKALERSDSVCCVCMERKKGAAFIPCGHTYCRVCSREVWLKRGSCPLCNRRILEILDIF